MRDWWDFISYPRYAQYNKNNNHTHTDEHTPQAHTHSRGNIWLSRHKGTETFKTQGDGNKNQAHIPFKECRTYQKLTSIISIQTRNLTGNWSRIRRKKMKRERPLQKSQTATKNLKKSTQHFKWTHKKKNYSLCHEDSKGFASLNLDIAKTKPNLRRTTDENFSILKARGNSISTA